MSNSTTLDVQPTLPKTGKHVCGVDAIPTLYQHITDKVFNHLLKVNCPIKPTAEATQSQLLDYNEKNALRYVAGYVTRKIKKF